MIISSTGGARSSKNGCVFEIPHLSGARPLRGLAALFLDSKPMKARPAGIEPTPTAPEAVALSVRPRAQITNETNHGN